LKNEVLDIVEGLAPSETKKEIAHRVGAGRVGTPAILGSIAPTVWKKRKRDDGDTPGQTGTLKRDQRSGCREVTTGNNRAMGR
jgi:hypothetical protein